MTTNNDEFWGDQDDWPDTVEHTPARPTVGAALGRWWNHFVGGGVTASRTHGAPASGAHEDVVHTLDHVPAPIGDPELGVDVGVEVGVDVTVDPDTRFDEGWDVGPESAHRPGVDPLLARLGGAAIVVTLLVPVLLGFSGNDDPSNELGDAAPESVAVVAPSTTAPAGTPSTGVAVTPAPDPGPSETAAPAVPATAAPADADPGQEPVTASASQGLADSAGESITASASASNGAERIEPICAIDYDVVAGDFWIRLADASGVPLERLLAANGASTNTPLFPGSTICLPEGARLAPPPTTTPTTVAPRPTTPATTVKPAPPAVGSGPLTAAQVQQIIRDVWPDELEERAIQIADRESNFVPTARNYCCHGVFQIYFNVHRSWLDDLGITSVEHLYDARLNARAAYTLYQRAGGWGPWT